MLDLLLYECLLEIFKRLNHQDISNVLQTCKSINRIKLISYFAKQLNQMRFAFKLSNCLHNKIQIQKLHKEYPWIVYADSPYFQANIYKEFDDCPPNHLVPPSEALPSGVHHQYMMMSAVWYFYNKTNYTHVFSMLRYGNILKSIKFNASVRNVRLEDQYCKKYLIKKYALKNESINLTPDIGNGVYKNIGFRYYVLIIPIPIL